MNIDHLSNLIEGSDVTTFRTIASIFLRSIGYPKAFLCDGPYDGGADFFVYSDPKTGIETAFQLSIEKNWRKKLVAEIKKTTTNYPNVKAFIFVSKRRIPLRSFQTENTKLIQSAGLGATHYDCQAIATEILDKNLIQKIYEILGIKPVTPPPSEFVSPLIEASTSLLLFGVESGDFRSEMFNQLILSELHQCASATEENFINDFCTKYNITSEQKPNITRLISKNKISKSIVTKDNLIELSKDQSERISSIRQTISQEFNELKLNIEAALNQSKFAKNNDLISTITSNLLQLSIGLWQRSAPQKNIGNTNIDETYQFILSTIESNLGKSEAQETINQLAEIVSNSEFSKQIASAQLFQSLVNTGSKQLVAALGKLCKSDRHAA